LIGAGSGAKAPVLGSREPGYGWIEKIRLEGAAPYQSDPEGESTERPERAKIDQRFDVAGPSDRRDGLVDDHQHTNDGRARMKFRMLHRPGQDADRRGTDGKPRSVLALKSLRPEQCVEQVTQQAGSDEGGECISELGNSRTN
jgi:hypothetical protein